MALLIKTKMKRFSHKLSLEQAFDDLLTLISVKRKLYVKARDLLTVLGVRNHHRITQLGVLLSTLAKYGLAIKWNNARPHRYSLIPSGLWFRFIETCGSLPPERRYRCGGCDFIDCPYQRVRKALQKEVWDE